jgi:hypothetical protein
LVRRAAVMRAWAGRETPRVTAICRDLNQFWPLFAHWMPDGLTM